MPWVIISPIAIFLFVAAFIVLPEFSSNNPGKQDIGALLVASVA
jgi:hypothetical protein